MAFYPDLTPYNYTHYSEVELNIGWLQKDNPFSVGEIPEGFLDNLKAYALNEVMGTLGWHDCEFCGKANSSAEIRVIGKDGCVYACPTLIIHYIEEHKYLPPKQFVDTVMEGPSPGSEEYKNIFNRLPEKWERRKPDINDSDYEDKLIKAMSIEMSNHVSEQILKDVLSTSPDLKNFIENYNKVMPSIYNKSFKNSSEVKKD